MPTRPLKPNQPELGAHVANLTLKSLQDLPSRGGAWETPLPARFRALEVDVQAL